ncbi:helix-turn-helix transcriptional regulator [bacterium]|nr:helix-turn-helix transcriptional regulator [bacterium]
MRDVYLVSTVRVSVSDDAPDRLEQVLAYMSQHCDDATLASVARQFNVHPNTISGMIRRETGRTFGEITRQMRLARAVALLRSGKVSVAQTARLCGYENPSNLYRVFKQEYGMTPRAYLDQLESQAASPDEADERGDVENDAEMGVRAGATATRAGATTGAGEAAADAPDGDDAAPMPRVRVHL